jgi:hypothetical protein
MNDPSQQQQQQQLSKHLPKEPRNSNDDEEEDNMIENLCVVLLYTGHSSYSFLCLFFLQSRTIMMHSTYEE